jgi:hypothetical protein
MTIALKPAREHSYRLSVYQRSANDFYPTPSDLAISLALGLPRLGLDLPRVALDPCGRLSHDTQIFDDANVGFYVSEADRG